MNQEWSYEDLIEILINLHYKILDSLKVLKINISNPENSLLPITLPNVLPLLTSQIKFYKLGATY